MLDLFSFADPAPVVSSAPLPEAPAYPVPRTAGSMLWKRILAQLGTDVVTFHVSELWTGIITEVATGGAIGRKGWDRDGAIVDLGPVGGFEPGRLVYLAPAAAAALHKRRPLVPFGREGTAAARFRLAAPGECAVATPTVLGRLAPLPQKGRHA